jgi:GTP cyclohydrolase I
MDQNENLVRQILIAIGEDPDREGLLDTPKRVVKAWKELYAGYKQNPAEILSTCFTDGTCDDMVLLKDITFNSTCEHHMEKIIGVAHVAYIPNGKVVGLSKLARLVDCYASRLQIQEKFTTQIADSIQEHLAPKGVAVVIEASHQCMSCRGIKKTGATMVTSAMHGVFRSNPVARHELLTLIAK